MYIPISFSIILQIICAVHAINTGRRQWLWIILIFSVIGCAIYVIVEVLPELKPAADQVASGTQDIITPNHKINKLKQELEMTDTVENRVALASAYIGRKQFDEAIKILEEFRGKPHGDDPEIIEQLGLAYFSKGEYEKCRDCLVHAKNSLGEFENQRVHLLFTVCLQKLQDIDGALKEYKELIQIFTGEEARCRYALFLKQLGSSEEANKIFKDIVHKCKISPPFYRREHKAWLDAAQAELKKSGG